MGDRTWTSIEFSGAISFEQAEELLQLLKDQGCYANHSDDTPKLDNLVNSDSFYDSDCNYSQMEDIEAWCGENNVSYLKSWEPGGGYGPGMEIWDDAAETTYTCATVESSPALTVLDLIAAKTEGTIDEKIAELSRFDAFSSTYPTLKVLKTEEWTDALCKLMAERALCKED